MRFVAVALVLALAACAEQGAMPVAAPAPVPAPDVAQVIAVPPVPMSVPKPAPAVTMDSFIGHWKGSFTNSFGTMPIEFAIGYNGSMSYWVNGRRQPIGEPRLDGAILTIPVAQQDVVTLMPVGENLGYTYDGRLGQVSTTLTHR